MDSIGGIALAAVAMLHLLVGCGARSELAVGDDSGSLVCADATPCDDGDPCTQNDLCSDGACRGEPLDCKEPASSSCLDADTTRFQGQSRCEAGECVADTQDLPCPFGCTQGSCAGLTTGAQATCASRSVGGVACWGLNDVGQLGSGTQIDSALPVTVPGIGHAPLLAAGLQHVCAADLSEASWCWGGNSSGQLGTGDSRDRNLPAAVVGSGQVRAIGAGISHSCAVTIAGTVACWGENSAGQLGNGTNFAQDTPGEVVGLGPAALAVVGGSAFTCALAGGIVSCWGSNQFGQLGNGGTDGSNVAVPVAGLPREIVSLSAGGVHACALSKDGAVHCWGRNEDGELGDGTAIDRSTPASVTGLPGPVRSIACGARSTCAVTSEHGVYCWGANDFGQLGDGSTLPSASPTLVTGLPGRPMGVSSGAFHTCSFTDVGLYCWGFNGNGQLGDGTYEHRSLPGPVAGF